MRAFKIVDIKGFMSKLLVQNTFDQFLVSEMYMNTFQRFEMKGKLNQDYYSQEELEELHGRTYAKWLEVKPFAYQIVKGNKTPSSFHINLMLEASAIDAMIKDSGILMKVEEISGLYFSIRYDNQELMIITGCGQRIFTLDKTLEVAWDEQVARLLKQQEIAVEN